MKKTELIITLIVLLSINLINAQQIIKSNVAEVLPTDVIKAIENKTKYTSVFAVGKEEHFDGQIIKADEIVFSENANLILDNIDAPWIILIAKKIKFKNPNSPARITFGLPDLPVPPKARNGQNGANGSGRNGRHGRPGSSGKPGATGIKGLTKNLPHIYIITKELTSPNGVLAFAPLAILGNGINGGRGGEGGNGGNGGNGVKGLDAADGPFDCRRGGGDGGNGGNAGAGGKGGDGGDGGNGVSVTIISTQENNEAFSYIQLLNSGGLGGPGGAPGTHGNPGNSGGMGRGSTYCSGGRSGSNGAIPDPPNLGFGNEGRKGKKGSFVLVSSPDLESLFQNN